VNKVNSKAVLRWNAQRSASIPDWARDRVLARLSSRLTADGYLVLSSDRFRDQPRNREDCLEKLQLILEEALHEPKARRKTKPSFSSRKKNRESKKIDSRKKTLRGKVRDY
jgi:ribosome-associated protein